MTIVVTGAGGFVGRRLVTRLMAAGHPVTAIDRDASAIPSVDRVIAGDFGDPAALDAVGDCTALIHLATVPGGAAEADPVAARRVNLDASLSLLDAVARSSKRPRVVFASSIAVFGDPLPTDGVDDDTPLAPKMHYGAHKAMVEIAAATLHRRGEIDAVSLRLPAIVARPPSPSGMKSAFISDLFHAIREGRPMVCPVSADATIWVQSLACSVDNLIHALTLETNLMPDSRALTLPALRAEIGALVEEIAVQCGASTDLISYQPDPAIQAAFGAQPPLSTPSADRAGFGHDGSLAALVSRTLEAAHVPA